MDLVRGPSSSFEYIFTFRPKMFIYALQYLGSTKLEFGLHKAYRVEENDLHKHWLGKPNKVWRKEKGKKKGRRVRPNSNVLDVRPTTIKVEPGLREIIRKWVWVKEV